MGIIYSKASIKCCMSSDIREHGLMFFGKPRNGRFHGRIKRGTGGPDPPPRNSQVIWVSIGNKQVNPLEKVGLPRKCWIPLEPWK